MNVEKVWEYIFKYSDYVKGADYSASDITGNVLASRLRKDNPNVNDMVYQDNISSFVGSAIHQRNESWLESENAFDITGWESEVKLQFKNISGTADIIIDGCIVLDYKTGKEANIKSKLRELDKGKESAWQQQISIYTYLNHKQNKAKYGDVGYIAWLCVDTNKHGVTEVKLLPKSETIELIKNFLTDIVKPIEEMDKCNLCVQFMHRWCGVRSVCPHWGLREEDNKSAVEEW